MAILQDLIARNNLPFTLMEDEIFQEFLHSLNPNFELVSANAMKNRLVKSYVMYKEVIANTINQPGNGKPSFSTDLWTSPNHFAMMVITCTWITNDFQMMEVDLAFRELLGQHTGSNICTLFLDVMKEYRLNKVSFSSYVQLHHD